MACQIVQLDQSKNPIDVQAGESTTLPERNELERLPNSGRDVPPSREAHRVLKEPAYGRRFLMPHELELIEDLFVDRDCCSHDAVA